MYFFYGSIVIFCIIVNNVLEVCLIDVFCLECIGSVGNNEVYLNNDV